MFFSPYSVLYWYDQSPNLEAILKVREYVADAMIKYDNVFLFDFQSESQLVLNLWNYKDTMHYSPRINDFIPKMLSDGRIFDI